MNEIQNCINEVGKTLGDAYQNKKAAIQSLKELKKELKEKLSTDSKYQEFLKKEKELKRIRKEMSEELFEIKKQKEQIAMETDEQREIDDFIADQEEKFQTKKEFAIKELAQSLKDQGLIAEINYKNGQISLIIIRL